MNRLPGSYIAVDGIIDGGSRCMTEPLSSLFTICKGGMNSMARVFLYGDRLIRVNPHWIRDYMLVVKSSRYTEADLTSLPDLLLEHQHESGFFYEILAPLTDMHGGYLQVKQFDGRMDTIVQDPYRCREPGTGFGLSRLELEADIEYLMVEGCRSIWQATGDDEWLRQQLPRLAKGLHYTTTNPIRWDSKYQLVKRPHTLDTWDFTDRRSSALDRMIRPEDPMGIFHGDNTGLYEAELLLAKMYRHFGETAEAGSHETFAAALRERIMKNLWNGRFFRHFLMLDPCDYGVDETYQMSLSNSYALNRGILTLEQRQSILQAYRDCRSKYGGELDDFRNLEPPFQHFMDRKPGEYVNGGNAPFVAGELAAGAFASGQEAYGADILDRIGRKFLRDGKVSFLYDWQERDIGGGPRSWCAAEVLYGLTEGLAGVHDDGKLFRQVTLSPRWAVTQEHHTHVQLEYPASGAVCEYDWKMDRSKNVQTIVLRSKHDECTLRVYVPAGTMPVSVTRNGRPVPFLTEAVADSHYAVVKNPAVEQPLVVQAK